MAVRVARPRPAVGRQPQMRSKSAAEAVVLVAGARAAAVNALLCALLAPCRRLPHTPRDTYLVITGGTARRVEVLPVGGPARVRRIDAVVADPLLELATIVAARAVTGDGEHHLADELLRGSGCLVLVTDGRLPYQPAELDLLHTASAGNQAIFLAVTHVDEDPGWADVVRANQSKLARNFSELALRPWYPVTRVRSGVPDLRRALFAWATAVRAPAPGGQRPPAIHLAATAAASPWQETLHGAIEREHGRALCRARAMLQALRSAAASPLGAAAPPQSPPGAATPMPAGGVGLRISVGPTGTQDSTGPAERLQQDLQAASLELARELRASADRVLCLVLSCILTAPPDAAVLNRVRAALRRDLAERTSGIPTCYRALRVTRTAVVAVASSREPVASLAAHQEPVRGVLPPLGIGLTASSLVAPADSAGDWLSRAWVDRGIDAVDQELSRELSRQFAHLHQALADLIAEAIDHDLLLV